MPTSAPAKVDRASAVGSRAPWIFVLGTSDPVLPEKMRVAAEHLGAALAHANFNLATFGWSGVDEAVARAFINSSGLRGEQLDNRLVHFVSANHQPRVSDGWIARFTTEADTISSAITYADAIVVIGGGFWTHHFLRRAAKAEIPVLPLADTSANNAIAAKNFFNHALKSQLYKRFDWNRKEFELLKLPAPGVVNHVVKLLLEHTSRTPLPPRLPLFNPSEKAIPRAFQELIGDQSRMAAFLVRATLRDRRSLAVLTEPDAALLSDTASRLNLKGPRELLDVEQQLEHEFRNFRPDPLWLAWFGVRHGDSVRQACESWAKQMLNAAPTESEAPSVPEKAMATKSFPRAEKRIVRKRPEQKNPMRPPPPARPSRKKK